MTVAESDRPPLVGVVEQLFQNLTIKLISSKRLQYICLRKCHCFALLCCASLNVPRPAKLSNAQVTSEAYHDVYLYTRHRLRIACSAATLCTTVAVILGLHAVAAMRTFYSSEFSTLLRVSPHAHLSHQVEKCNASGKVHLPECMEDATIMLPVVHREEKHVAKTGPDVVLRLLKPQGRQTHGASPWCSSS